jgi:LysM repeat protein
MLRKHSELILTALIACLIIVVFIGFWVIFASPEMFPSASLTPTITVTPTTTVTFTPSRTSTPTYTETAGPIYYGSVYVVQQGDTFAAIAQHYGVTVSELQAANPGVGSYLYAGQVIRIPSSSSWFKISESSETPNPTQTLQAAYNEVDKQFQSSMKSNIAYNKPESMRIGDTTVIELLLNPSSSEPDLAKQIAEHGEFVTSTAEPAQFFSQYGEEVTIETSSIEITDRMKATLISLDPEAFVVQELHDSPDQVISAVDTTKWRWSITAKVEGTKSLNLIMYRLIKYQDKEYWREVETYKADIVVEVAPVDPTKSVDWKWLIGIILTMIVIPAFWRWFDNRRNTDQPFKKKKPGARKRNTKK